MRKRAKRWVLGIAFGTVVGTTAAGVLVLREEFSSSEGSEPVYEATAGEVSWDYLLAIDRRDAKAAAALTDDPAAAQRALSTVFTRLPDATVRTTQHELDPVDGDRATVGFDVAWSLGDGKTWEYENSMTLEKLDGRWRVDWTPRLVHPKLGPGQHLAVGNGVAGKPAVLDADGASLLDWDASGAGIPRQEGRQPLLAAMARYASEQAAADSWTVVAVDGKGERKKLLHGKDQSQGLVSTLRASTQASAQAAVGSAGGASALVAIRPSTGEIIAVAQNRAAGESPVALTGLYPPGSTFKIATATAVLRVGAATVDTVLHCPGKATIGTRTIPNDHGFDLGEVPLRTAFAHSCNTTFGRLAVELPADALAHAADSLGINADFAIPGITTEAGAVRPAEDDVQRLEDGIGQGKVQASPFGVALMTATVAAGKPVTPKLWRDIDTEVIEGYQAPPAAVLAGVRSMMRQVVTAGSASALSGHGEVFGKTGTAQTASGTAHGWFAGYRGDVAFAAFVADAGSSKPAVAVAAEFLGS